MEWEKTMVEPIFFQPSKDVIKTIKNQAQPKKATVVRVQSFEQYHNKTNTGSGKIRVKNLLKHWPKAALYKYGEKADVMIFQKVYCTYDYKFPKNFPGIKILDVCDPDWTGTPDIYIKETIDAMDGIVVPTENLKKLIAQMTDTPVRVIKDRFDMDEFPAPKVHEGQAKQVVWFGYSHNSVLMNHVIPSLENRGLNLTVISDNDPHLYRFANDSVGYDKKYNFVKYDQATIYSELQKADVCVLPKGYRPEDRYKSENKTVIAQLCGLPVVQDTDTLEEMMSAENRNKHINTIYGGLKQEFDCQKSVAEYKALIDELKRKVI